MQSVRKNPPTVLPALSPKVRLSMEHRLERMEAAIDVDPAEYFDELNHFMPIREMPKHVRMAIAGFKVDPLSFVTEVKFVDRINATRLYSQLAGDMPREKQETPPAAVPGGIDWRSIPSEERTLLRNKIAASIAEAVAAHRAGQPMVTVNGQGNGHAA